MHALILPEMPDAEILLPLEELLDRYRAHAIMVKPEYRFDERARL